MSIRNPRKIEERQAGGLLTHAGMTHEARLYVAYEELRAITRYAIGDRYASIECKTMASQIDAQLGTIWGVIGELADERLAKEKAQ